MPVLRASAALMGGLGCPPCAQLLFCAGNMNQLLPGLEETCSWSFELSHLLRSPGGGKVNLLEGALDCGQ